MIDQKIELGKELINTTLDHFDQIKELLNNLENHQYSSSLNLLSGSSLGQHIRHIVEFYQCLLESGSNGTICYDKRKRNPLIENNKSEALKAFNNIAFLLNKSKTDYPLKIISMVSANSNQEIKIASSFYRELLYNLEHIIHHLAIVKVAIKQCFPQVNLAENLGVASSTIKFRNS